MKATIENTDKIVTLVVNGVDIPARVWQGVTEQGVEFHAFITRVAVAKDDDASQFERDLREMAPLTPAVAGIPLRLIL